MLPASSWAHAEIGAEQITAKRMKTTLQSFSGRFMVVLGCSLRPTERPGFSCKKFDGKNVRDSI